MAFISGPFIGQQICRILGVEANMVRSIRIDFAVDDVVLITIERYAAEDELSKIVKILNRFRWIERRPIVRVSYQASALKDEDGRGRGD